MPRLRTGRRRRAALRAGLFLSALCAVFSVSPMTHAAPRLPGAELEPVAFAALDGWADDDHAAALAAFRRSCAAISATGVEGGSLKAEVAAGLEAACRFGQALGPDPDHVTARGFFERA